MKSTESTNVLSKHLLKTLELFKVDEPIVGPKGDTYHHFQEIHALKGDDDYTVSAVTSISENSILSTATKLRSPMRFRGMSGVCIVFWSEECYLWSRSLFFHKGCVYQEDVILQSNVDIYPEEKDDFTKPAEEHY